jgi:adenosylcobinamide-phosphate synthase
VGLLLGALLDRAVGDPRRRHPVAGYGRLAAALERRWYADDRRRGAAFATVAVAGPALAGAGLVVLARRAGRWSGPLECVVTATATWAVLGGESLGREGAAMAESLVAGDLEAGRARLRNLCARDAAGLGEDEVARATVESLAENTSDAVVAPLLWGAVGGVPAMLGYRAVNTLDAMVGYRSPRYERFGWASARADDVANLVPARVAGLLAVAGASRVGGDPWRAWAVWRRDARSHPSPNAGHVEAAFAGALGVRLGGANSYGGEAEIRPGMGEGNSPAVADIARAVRLGRFVGWSAVAAAVGLAVLRSLNAGHPERAGR